MANNQQTSMLMLYMLFIYTQRREPLFCYAMGGPVPLIITTNGLTPFMKNKLHNTTLSIATLRSLGFIIPSKPLQEEDGLKIYGIINKFITRKRLFFPPCIQKCPSFAISEINKQEIFIVYTPLPRIVTDLQELLDYCKIKMG